MRIGILIRDFHLLSNWELRIIKEIQEDDNLELKLLIKDGRSEMGNTKNIIYKVRKLIKSKNILGTILFKLQSIVESKLFYKKLSSNDKDKIVEYLSTIKVEKISPKRKGFIDYFDEDSVSKLKSYGLDVILRHEFNIIRGELLNSSKYGVWSFHHADNTINRGGPPGFWEVFLKQPYIGVTLQQLTPELDGGLVIDKAYFNPKWNFTENRLHAYESSVTLLMKNIRLLNYGIYEPKKSKTYYNPLYKVPDWKVCSQYIFYFYKVLIIKALKKLNSKAFGVRYGCWALFIGQGNIFNATLFRLKLVKPAKREFWADPFIFTHEKLGNYIFFENYEYDFKKGKISVAQINDGNMINVRDVLIKDYHLSFPNVFYENDDIYMMPETNANRRLEIYKCVEFPDKWELFSTAFEGYEVADPFFYDDPNGQKWLFLNKRVNSGSDMANELYIYKVDSIMLNSIEPHKLNPVLIDARVARNAGKIIYFENSPFRPSQSNVDGVYGKGLNLNRIKSLSLDSYEEEVYSQVLPNFHKDLVSTHHVSQADGLFVIDAAFKKL